MTPAGAPPTDFAESVEPVFVWVERAPGDGNYDIAPYLGASWRLTNGANEVLQRAEFAINLGYDPLTVASTDALPKDWQVVEADANTINVWRATLKGRRVYIATGRADPADDWILFFGILQKVEPGWSGATPRHSRWATAYAASIVEHAGNEPGQALLGQWRRSRGGELALRGEPGGTDNRQCIEVAASPVIFNPGGRPNCARDPIAHGNGQKTYIFTDPDAPDAVHWTVARMLRYVEWALMQPWPSQDPGNMYDVARFGYYEGPAVLQELGRWTTYGLKHRNLDELLDPVVEQDDSYGAGANEQALLRVLPDIGIDHFSGVEAFTYLGARAGIAFSIEHEPVGAISQTYLHWTIRSAHGEAGGRGASSAPPGLDPPRPGSGHSDPTDSPEPRGLFIYVPADGTTAADILAAVGQENVTEGAITMDESPTRNEVRVQGEADQYEITVELLPGWKPDPWVDVDITDADAVQIAVERIGTAEFNQRYVIDQMVGQNRKLYGHVLRRWVLNEHGLYTPGHYRRGTTHPWDQNEDWYPYAWRTQGNVFLLAARGDNGWTLRRRRFLPTVARWWDEAGIVDPVELGVLVQLSFDAGATWTFQPTQIFNEPDECAIYFAANDLTTVVDSPDSTVNLVNAYIRGDLRVRVIANIEGDDAVAGLAGWRDTSPLELIVTDHVNRRGQFGRALRYKPHTNNPAANTVLIDEYGIESPNRDDEPEVRRAADRLRNELENRLVSGRVTIPYLLKDGEGPWQGYRIGDEILGIITQDSATFVNMGGSTSARQSAARIVGINYVYNEQPTERSTELVIEEWSFEDVEHQAGDPQVSGPDQLDGVLDSTMPRNGAEPAIPVM